MNQVTLLRQSLPPHLAWHGARCALFSHVPHCSVPCQNSQSSWGAQPDLWEKRKLIHITNDSNASSATRELNYYEIAKVIVGMRSHPWTLGAKQRIARAWQFGQTTFNILTLGIVPVQSCISHSVVDAGEEGKLQHRRADRVARRSYDSVSRT